MARSTVWHPRPPEPTLYLQDLMPLPIQQLLVLQLLEAILVELGVVQPRQMQQVQRHSVPQGRQCLRDHLQADVSRPTQLRLELPGVVLLKYVLPLSTQKGQRQLPIEALQSSPSPAVAKPPQDECLQPIVGVNIWHSRKRQWL